MGHRLSLRADRALRWGRPIVAMTPDAAITQAKEQRAVPVRAGDCLGDARQRAVSLALPDVLAGDLFDDMCRAEPDTYVAVRDDGLSRYDFRRLQAPIPCGLSGSHEGRHRARRYVAVL